MRRQGKSAVALSLGIFVLLIVSTIAYVFNASSFEREVPKIALEKEIEWNFDVKD